MMTKNKIRRLDAKISKTVILLFSLSLAPLNAEWIKPTRSEIEIVKRVILLEILSNHWETNYPNHSPTWWSIMYVNPKWELVNLASKKESPVWQKSGEVIYWLFPYGPVYRMFSFDDGKLNLSGNLKEFNPSKWKGMFRSAGTMGDENFTNAILTWKHEKFELPIEISKLSNFLISNP